MRGYRRSPNGQRAISKEELESAMRTATKREIAQQYRITVDYVYELLKYYGIPATSPYHFRRCSRCNEPGEFRTRVKDGRIKTAGQCRKCERELAAEYVKANPSRVKDASRRSYEKHKIERRRSCQRWQRENIDKARAARKRWAKEHPDKVNDIVERRRANLANIKWECTQEHWRQIVEYFNGACAYCLRTDRKLTKDHIWPISRGGAHVAENIVPSCLPCNMRKKDRLIFVMLNR